MEWSWIAFIAFGLMTVISGLVYRDQYNKNSSKPFTELRLSILPSFVAGIVSMILAFVALTYADDFAAWGVLIVLVITMIIMALVSPRTRIRIEFYNPWIWISLGALFLLVGYGPLYLGAGIEWLSSPMHFLVTQIGLWTLFWGTLLIWMGKKEIRRLYANRV